jgi:TldD protein
VRALLSPQAAATLLHELLGHPLEGDLLLAGASPWRGRQGERILSLPLDLQDDPTRTDLPGAFETDDEGHPAAARYLLREGVLTGALATGAFAAALGVAPGNARRATPHTLPRPRVSNLVARCPGALVAPPRDDAEVEIEAISSGTIEPRAGVVVLQVRVAHTLRHGRRVRGLAPFTLLGRLPAVAGGLLAAAAPGAVSAEPGWCGKEGEVVPTGSDTPWLLVEGLEAR